MKKLLIFILTLLMLIVLLCSCTDIPIDTNTDSTENNEPLIPATIDILKIGKADFRKIQVSQNFNEYRKKSLANITSDEGILLRMNRSIQVEGVFGVLKQDYGFRRFLTRGKKKIETQFFLLAFAFNIQKLCNRIEKNRFNMDLFPLKDTA